MGVGTNVRQGDGVTWANDAVVGNHHEVGRKSFVRREEHLFPNRTPDAVRTLDTKVKQGGHLHFRPGQLVAQGGLDCLVPLIVLGDHFKTLTLSGIDEAEEVFAAHERAWSVCLGKDHCLSSPTGTKQRHPKVCPTNHRSISNGGML